MFVMVGGCDDGRVTVEEYDSGRCDDEYVV